MCDDVKNSDAAHSNPPCTLSLFTLVLDVRQQSLGVVFPYICWIPIFLSPLLYLTLSYISLYIFTVKNYYITLFPHILATLHPFMVVIFVGENKTSNKINSPIPIPIDTILPLLPPPPLC